MNREILFRGKQKDNNNWVYGGIVHQNNLYGNPVDRWFIINRNCTYNYNIYDEIKSESRGQYTGLTDKNGTKIFEGDIVHLTGNPDDENTRMIDYHALVIFSSGGFCAIDGTPDNHCFTNYRFATCDLNCEVIGNIHDNPELLDD